MRKAGQLCGTAIGLWLMAAPAVLDCAGSPASDFHRLVGPVVASLSVIALWEATAGVRWPNLVAAAALLLAPLAIDHMAAAAVTGIAGGALLAVATPFGGERRRRIGGGWARLVVAPADQGGGEESADVGPR